MNEYHYYFQRYPINGEEQVIKDLEIDFPNCAYMSFEGVSDYGEIKNIETEEYAEADMPRTFIPDKVCRNTTTVTLKLYFKGDTFRDDYDEFISYISGHKLKYWDTFRNRELHLLFTGEAKVSEEFNKKYKKGLVAEITFTNLKGLSEKKV